FPQLSLLSPLFLFFSRSGGLPDLLSFPTRRSSDLPAYFYQQMLGLPDDTVYLQVPSPFASQQLQVKVARHISTRYRDRSTAIGPLCDIIEQQVTAATGNYLAFFSDRKSVV